MSLTLFDKLWNAHVVVEQTADAPAVLYIDLHLIHEVTSPQAFAEIESRGLKVRCPESTLGTLDHSTPTLAADASGRMPYASPEAEAQVQRLRENAARHGVELLDFDSAARGIVHVVAPELGLSRPGSTIVCGDSHTATHGAFAALAFGIGTSEVAQVLATQCVLQRKPRSMAVNVEGVLAPGVSAKDLVLHIIARLGMDGGTGHVIEYRGSTIRALSMEARMTVCNMSIEAGARAGLIAADEVTFDYLAACPRVPRGAAFEALKAEWSKCHSDPGARFDREIHIDAAEVRPTYTWGTQPAQSIAADAAVPRAVDPETERALAYMGLRGGHSLLGTPVDVVFVGSCTNSRIEDLRAMAEVLRGHHVHPRVRMLVVPGSVAVKHAAEAEGIADIVRAAGAEWREPGCSMCIAMNGDLVAPGRLAVSTSNRNFEGRQGPGARTILASPAAAAACAIEGAIADPRNHLEQEQAA